MVVKLLRPFSFLAAMGAMIVLALSGPASSEGYGDPVIVPEDGGTTEVQPGEPFEVAFTSNVEMRSGAPAFGTPESMRAAMDGHEPTFFGKKL